MNKDLSVQILEQIEDADEKEQYFVDRTTKHIELVKKAALKIADAGFTEFDPNELMATVELHDASKFDEPERTPYIDLTWNKFKGIKDTDPLINDATLHHITMNAHHPEYWNKEQANISATDRDKSDIILDASRMPPVAIAEMVADWQAMSEELGTNTAREWFDRQKDVRWHFSDEQISLIDNLLKIFE